MRTCCDIVRDTSLRAMATIREPFRITLGIGISATRFDIRNCRRPGSKTFGGIKCHGFEHGSPTRYGRRCLCLKRARSKWFDAALMTSGNGATARGSSLATGSAHLNWYSSPRPRRVRSRAGVPLDMQSCSDSLRDPRGYWTGPPSRTSNDGRFPTLTGATARVRTKSLQNIRLSSDMANPLSRSRNWRAVGDRCVGLRLLQMLRRQRGSRV
jgi:hypothetical protein